MKKKNSVIALFLSIITIVSTQTSCALRVSYIPPVVPKAAPPIETTDKKDLSSVDNCKLKNTIFDDKDRLGFPVKSEHPIALGNRKAITLFADFSDYLSDKNHMTSMLEVQIPKAETFYHSSSYGKYSLEFDHIKKVYHFGNHLNYVSNGLLMGNSFINQVMSAADNDVDFSKYDFVNIVTPSEYDYDSGSYGMRGTYDGKSFYYALLGTAATSKDDGRGWEPWLVHETGHIIGMIHASNDWYPYIWDVSVNAVSTAPDLYAWNKFLLGWMDNSQIDCIDKINKTKTTHLISPLGLNSKQTKVVIIKINNHSAVVIENRSKTKIDKDLGMFQEGVLVYIVDINKTGGANNMAISIVDPTRISNSGAMQVGKSVTVEGYKIDVLQKQKSDYLVSITK